MTILLIPNILQQVQQQISNILLDHFYDDIDFYNWESWNSIISSLHTLEWWTWFTQWWQSSFNITSFTASNTIWNRTSLQLIVRNWLQDFDTQNFDFNLNWNYRCSKSIGNSWINIITTLWDTIRRFVVQPSWAVLVNWEVLNHWWNFSQSWLINRGWLYLSWNFCAFISDFWIRYLNYTNETTFNNKVFENWVQMQKLRWFFRSSSWIHFFFWESLTSWWTWVNTFIFNEQTNEITQLNQNLSWNAYSLTNCSNTTFVWVRANWWLVWWVLQSFNWANNITLTQDFVSNTDNSVLPFLINWSTLMSQNSNNRILKTIDINNPTQVYEFNPIWVIDFSDWGSSAFVIWFLEYTNTIELHYRWSNTKFKIIEVPKSLFELV